MNIQLNNQIVEVEAQLVLYELVFQQLGEKQNGIAVAINNQVIPKSLWSETILKNDDEVLIIKATQGG